MGIETLLNTIFITLQDRRKESKQDTSATLPLKKGMKPKV